MTDDTPATDSTDTDDTDGPRRTLDVRTDDEQEADDELDRLLEEYQRQKESDGPVDDKLQQLADKHGETADEPAADDAGDAQPDTGETTVRIGDEVEPDEADFIDEPDEDDLADVDVNEDAKAKRRAAREAAETRSAGDQTGGPDTVADDLDEATTVSDLADEYDIDTDAREQVDDNPDHDAEPAMDVDPDELGPATAGDIASYEDIADEGVLPEVDPGDDFDFEDQDPDAVSDRPEPRTIALPTDGDEPVYVKLGSPSDDECINIVEAMQQASGLEERMYVVVANVVEKPSWAPEKLDEWAFGVRMSLFGECTRQLGLDDLQDFR